MDEEDEEDEEDEAKDEVEEVDSRRMLGDVPGLPYMSLEDGCLCMVSVACELRKIHKAIGKCDT